MPENHPHRQLGLLRDIASDPRGGSGLLNPVHGYDKNETEYVVKVLGVFEFWPQKGVQMKSLRLKECSL